MLQLPYTHGRYRLIERIAQGGMAEIYRANYHGDGGFRRTLAVKRILPQWSQDPQFSKMLQDEAKLLVKLQHQHIVQVFELGDDNGVFYISMEYVDGVDLRTLLNALRARSEVITPKFAYWIASDVLRALGFAHSRVDENGRPLNIVHRDVSPQNILLAWQGEVKVADFGIAKGRHRDHETTLGQLKGKLAYMSPEQARGEAIDSRSDIFSLGIVFFELLTGARLFDGDSDMDVLKKVQQAVIPAGWERDVAPEIRAILRKSLKKNPDDRYQTAEEMLTALSDYTARHRCQIFGFEFTPHLKKLFPEKSEVLQSSECDPQDTQLERGLSLGGGSARGQSGMPAGLARSETGNRLRKLWRVCCAPWQSHGLPRCHPFQSVTVKHALNILAVIGLAFVPHALRTTEVSAMVVPPPITKMTSSQPLPVATPMSQPASTGVATPPPASAPVASHSVSAVPKSDKGRLSVQVRPWGYVTIPGVVNRRESPVAMPLSEGEYQVKVFYEPANQWLSARASIRPGAHTTCQASFGPSPRIVCK